MRSGLGHLATLPVKLRNPNEHSTHSGTKRIDDAEVFRALVQAVRDYAIFVLDPQGNIQTWNDGAQHLKGYAASEAIGRHFSHFLFGGRSGARLARV